jgi:hypothetical protein
MNRSIRLLIGLAVLSLVPDLLTKLQSGHIFVAHIDSGAM